MILSSRSNLLIFIFCLRHQETGGKLKTTMQAIPLHPVPQQLVPMITFALSVFERQRLSQQHLITGKFAKLEGMFLWILFDKTCEPSNDDLSQWYICRRVTFFRVRDAF